MHAPEVLRCRSVAGRERVIERIPMHNPRLSLALALLVAATSASAGEPAADARIRQVENNLLPRVALKENLGRPATLTQRMQEFGIPGISIAVIDGGKIVLTRAYGVS